MRNEASVSMEEEKTPVKFEREEPEGQQRTQKTVSFTKLPTFDQKDKIQEIEEKNGRYLTDIYAHIKDFVAFKPATLKSYLSEKVMKMSTEQEIDFLVEKLSKGETQKIKFKDMLFAIKKATSYEAPDGKMGKNAIFDAL